LVFTDTNWIKYKVYLYEDLYKAEQLEPQSNWLSFHIKDCPSLKFHYYLISLCEHPLELVVDQCNQLIFL